MAGNVDRSTGKRMGAHGDGPLFETTAAKGRLAYKLFAGSVFLGVCLIWVYRATHVPGEGRGRWPWLGLLAADVWFGLYWVLTQSVRWNPTYRRSFPDSLSRRYEEELPGVDVFVCTADPTIEPPAMVVNTVLSVMAYDYPAEKLAVYLSDDGGSDLTFYALLEASHFARVWIPFCNKLQLEPRSPAAYFREVPAPPGGGGGGGGGCVPEEYWWAVQKAYKEMENKIDTATKLGRIPVDVRKEHKGFLEWKPGTTSRDHQPIVQILIDGRDSNAGGAEGSTLPTLVYMAREKRPHRHHNFKAGAMNSLIRVSSEISNGPIILNLDCDMYSNDSKSVRDALCFFMDEREGHEIGYVQFPQKFNNITKNDIYGNTLRMYNEVHFPGLDGLGGPLYVGSGCFHRRWSLIGNKYEEACKEDLKTCTSNTVEESVLALEEKAKLLATCTYEDNTQWGHEISSIWFIPFAYVIVAGFAYNIWECLRIGFTFKAWLNDKRMWLFKRSTSYLFAFVDTLLKLVGLNRSAFVVTAKVADKDVTVRYEKEVMEFGSSSLLFIILATLALLNLVCLVAGAWKLLLGGGGFEEFFLQFLICGLLVIVNAPLYQGLFFRKDDARMPTVVTVISASVAMFICFVTLL